ncbi:MAG: arylsulfatase [Verrucomicrobiales bacterium]
MKRFLILTLTFSLGFSTIVCADDLAGSKPNIIVLITDDQGYAPVGRHGHPWIKTPNMDTLFDTSTRFDRMLVAPTCSPTRAALMGGRHPMKNGITHTILERERMNPETITLPQILRDAGYTTGIFGKWHLGDEDTHQPHNRGFDEAFIHGAGGIGQAYACSCADAPGNKYFNPVIRHNGSFVKTDGYCTDLFYNAGLGWIKDVKDKDEPFFAYITTNAPHGPFIAPPENEKRFTDLGFGEKEAGFYGMIENIDENIGLLLEKLNEWKLMENTLIVFMSDNGMTGGGSGRPGQSLGTDEKGSDMSFYNAAMKGMKGSCDEGGVRVPFFMRWDGKIKPNVQVDTIAAHFDIYPTLAMIAGAKIPTDQVEGRSLVPLIDDPKAVWEDRYLFTHQARWPTGSEPDDFQWVNFGVRNQQYRYVAPRGGAPKKPRKKKGGKAAPAAKVDPAPKIGSLFDMQKDPGQKNDIAADHPEVIKAMKGAYDEFWKETRPLMVNEETPMSKKRPFHVWFEEQSKSASGIPSWKKRHL